jgi:hypothetical protein
MKRRYLLQALIASLAAMPLGRFSGAQASFSGLQDPGLYEELRALFAPVLPPLIEAKTLPSLNPQEVSRFLSAVSLLHLQHGSLRDAVRILWHKDEERRHSLSLGGIQLNRTQAVLHYLVLADRKRF